LVADNGVGFCQSHCVLACEWSPAVWCLVGGFAALAIGGAALARILLAQGRARAMTRDELTDRVMRFDPNDYADVATSHGAGVRNEASMDLPRLRRMAKRGEWGLFWSWPIMLSGFFGGIQLLGTAGLLFDGKTGVAWIFNVCFAPFTLSGWFLAWAALYTKIDAE
jgi:hypothetical protein